ncbi:hypothetical protein H4Q26_017225 [Puccinia striiformis f. sp. tritici PST-130]|nr:hypothetical protein H4Q26_017225 [Puccinia striiformis f. sp. tritici PST-130]
MIGVLGAGLLPQNLMALFKEPIYMQHDFNSSPHNDRPLLPLFIAIVYRSEHRLFTAHQIEIPPFSSSSQIDDFINFPTKSHITTMVSYKLAQLISIVVFTCACMNIEAGLVSRAAPSSTHVVAPGKPATLDSTKLQPVPGSAGGGGKLPPLSEAEKASLIEKFKAKAAAGGTPGASLVAPLSSRKQPKRQRSPSEQKLIPGSGNNKPTQKHPEEFKAFMDKHGIKDSNASPIGGNSNANPTGGKGSSKPPLRSLLHLAPAAATQMGDELMILIQTSPFIPLFSPKSLP